MDQAHGCGESKHNRVNGRYKFGEWVNEHENVEFFCGWFGRWSIELMREINRKRIILLNCCKYFNSRKAVSGITFSET